MKEKEFVYVSEAGEILNTSRVSFTQFFHKTAFSIINQNSNNSCFAILMFASNYITTIDFLCAIIVDEKFLDEAELIMGIKKKSISRKISEMSKNTTLAKHRNGLYYINPRIFFRGNQDKHKYAISKFNKLKMENNDRQIKKEQKSGETSIIQSAWNVRGDDS